MSKINKFDDTISFRFINSRELEVYDCGYYDLRTFRAIINRELDQIGMYENIDYVIDLLNESTRYWLVEFKNNEGAIAAKLVLI